MSIERRAPFPKPEDDYDRGGDYEGQRYGGPRGYPVDDQRGFHGDGQRGYQSEDQRGYHGEDQRGYQSESMHFGNERRNAPHQYKRVSMTQQFRCSTSKIHLNYHFRILLLGIQFNSYTEPFTANGVLSLGTLQTLARSTQGPTQLPS